MRVAVFNFYFQSIKLRENSPVISVGVFPMSTQNFIIARCSTFFANVPFFSNADPVFSVSNPDF
jgi:hypothetical protein